MKLCSCGCRAQNHARKQVSIEGAFTLSGGCMLHPNCRAFHGPLSDSPSCLVGVAPIVFHGLDMATPGIERAAVIHYDGENYSHHPVCPTCSEAIDALQTQRNELAEKLRRAQQEIDADDKLLADRDLILKTLPCPDHGPCVPYALNRIDKWLKAEKAASSGAPT